MFIVVSLLALKQNAFMIDKKEIEIAAEIIKKGGVVAFPTETVYGLGANALDPIAVAKIFEIKERPFFDPLIVHVASFDDVEKLSKNTDSRLKLLADQFWPGPLTIVLQKSDLIPDIVSAGLETVGIRIPDNEIALALIKASNCPIAAPSANKFGMLSPTSAQHVKKNLKGVDYILEGGKTNVGIESTIISLNENGFEILRSGFITKEDIEVFVPYFEQTNKTEKNQVAPGMLNSHYSPQKPIFILGDKLPADFKRKKAAFICFKESDISDYKIVEKVSENGDLKEYAANIFSTLHRLEESEIDFIVAEPVPNIGVGIAINDKLKKASFRYKIID
jgi:L-threonylcarbamoyladenylate synthase